MANESLNFTINLNGNAYKGILQIDDSLKGVLNSVDSARSAFKKLGDASVRFDSIVNTIGKISDGFKFLAGDSLKFEQTQLNLQTLLGGSAEAADELVGKLREYGKNTVYDFNGLAEAQKTMMSFGIEGNPAHTGEIFTDNCAYVKSCNRKKKNLVQRYAGDKFLRKETQQSLREVQGKSVSLKKQNEQIDVLFDSKTTSHLSNDVARCSNFLWNEIIKDIKSVLKKSKLIAYEPNRKLDKKPSAVEYFYYEYKINGKSLFISVEENFVKNEYRHFYRLYAISNTLRDSVIFY